jgi:hypothetical protein
MRECQPTAPSPRRTPGQVVQSLAGYLEAQQEIRRAASWVLTLLAQEEARPMVQRKPEMTWPPPAEPSASMEQFPGQWKKGLLATADEIQLGLASMHERGHDKVMLEDVAHDVANGVVAVANRQAVRTYGHWPTQQNREFDGLVVAKFDILAKELVDWINEQRLKDPVVDVKA